MKLVSRIVPLALLTVVQLTNQQSVHATPFPISGDGTYSVNVIRRFDPTGNFLPSIAGVSGTGSFSVAPTHAIDGAGEKAQWDDSSAAPNANAAGSLQITLDTTYALKKFQTAYLSTIYRPADYQIRVSTTGFGSMTTVVPYGTFPNQVQVDLLGSPANAKYIELNWKGTVTHPYVLVQEFTAYADSTNSFAIDTTGGFDLIAQGLTTGGGPISATYLNAGANWLGDPINNALDLNTFTYIRGAGTGDALLQVDLGAVHNLMAFSLGFYQTQTWGAGAMIEVSQDNVSFSTVFNQNTSLASANNIAIAPTLGRYVRITNYGGSGGALTDFQAFATLVPEPGSFLLLSLGGVFLLARTRQRWR